MFRRLAFVFLSVVLPRLCTASTEVTTVGEIVADFNWAKKVSDPDNPPCAFIGTIKERSTILGSLNIRMWNLRIQVDEVLCGSVSDSIDVYAPCYFYFDRGRCLIEEVEYMPVDMTEPAEVQRIHPLNGEGISTVEPVEPRQSKPQAPTRDVHPIFLPGDRIFVITWFTRTPSLIPGWFMSYARFLLDKSDILSAQTTDDLDSAVLKASEEAGTIPPDTAFVRRKFKSMRVRLSDVRPALQNKCKKH